MFLTNKSNSRRCDTPDAKTIDYRNTVAIIQSLALGISAFLFVLVLPTGNLLILAGPLALWTTVVGFPRSKDRTVKKRSVMSRRRKETIKRQGSCVSRRFYLAAAVWITTVIILWSRVTHTTISDTQIATAMDRASLLFKEGRYEEALARFWVIEVPECFPNRRAQKYHNIGLIQLKLGNSQEAEAALQEAVSYDPKDIDAYYLLVRIAFESKQYSKANQYLHNAESQIQNDTTLPEPFRILKTELEKFQSEL